MDEWTGCSDGRPNARASRAREATRRRQRLRTARASEAPLYDELENIFGETLDERAAAAIAEDDLLHLRACAAAANASAAMRSGRKSHGWLRNHLSQCDSQLWGCTRWCNCRAYGLNGYGYCSIVAMATSREKMQGVRGRALTDFFAQS